MTQTLRLDPLVDSQRFSLFTFNLVFWSFVAMLADGYDMAAISYAQPQLQTIWHLPKQAFGLVSSASVFGILLGAPLFGLAGDRFGRRTAMTTSSAIYGLCSLAVVFARNLHQIELLRFLTGLGLGGIMPNAIALVSESAPGRLRALLVTLMFLGVSVGSSVCGLVAYGLMPQYGWQVLFAIGGVVPLVAAAVMAWRLPESVRFLAINPLRRPELLATLRRMRPDISVDSDAIVSLDSSEQPSNAAHTHLRQIFAGRFALITPLLWLSFAMALMANTFLNSFLPLIFSDTLGGRQASLVAALYPVGGMLGGLLISALVERLGMIAIAALFVLASLAITALGLAPSTFAPIAAFTILSGLAVQGAQYGNNAAASFLYATGVRAKGVGWALGIGRVGALVGPMLGSRLLGLPNSQLFAIAATPMALGACIAGLLVWRCYERTGTLRLSAIPVNS